MIREKFQFLITYYMIQHGGSKIHVTEDGLEKNL